MSNGFSLEEAAAKVTKQWITLIENSKREKSKLLSVILAASKDPILGKLFPFTSLDVLCFSRCVDYPYWVDIFIKPIEKDIFSLKRVDGTFSWVEGKEIGTGNVGEIIKIAVSYLPNNYGPALPGNADIFATKH